MNPVKQLAEQLTVVKPTKGIVKAFKDDLMLIAVNESLEWWPKQAGLAVGNVVYIYNGRIIRSPRLSQRDVFEV
ncbi:MAG: hypothetical protein B6247_07760 [Candidatus Parabeggiatoa sp. nov. 2]|nr:MAG: hypothetical protein B6247_07760 [Beggiatoa sp. 4572_84]